MSFRDLRTRWQSLRRKRLAFEVLESRDLLAVMRIVDWNAANHPNNSTEDTNFQTILQAIGNETVQGNTQRIDILALQETDGASDGGSDSIGRIQSIFNGLYPTTIYSSAISPLQSGDATGFVYNTSTVSLLQSVEVDPGQLQHSVLRGKFQPVGSPDSTIFYVYSIHLKSGSTGNDASLRGTDAALLRADADSLGEGAQVLFVGDFNMQTSSELAYNDFLASGPGQLRDVGNAPGNWLNNPAFLSVHSHDPRLLPPNGSGSGMNDRFDIQFASGEFYDGVGLEYVSNSYHVFGNNGTHTLGGSIKSGTGASSAVLDALAGTATIPSASDHLPVVADYQILVSTPNVRITETLGGTKVAEGGYYDTYHVVLDTVPTANVTVNLFPNSQVTVDNGASLIFTPANALTPQTVIVRAFNDNLLEGDHTGSITHTSSSSDSAYNGLSIPSVNVSIIDNDDPVWTINEVDSNTPGTPDVLEFIEIYDGGAGNVSLNGKSIVFFDGSDDKSNGSAFDLTGYQTNANGFFVLANSGVLPAGPSVLHFPDGDLQNGADAVALYAAPASSFPNNTPITLTNLLDAVVYDNGQADDAGLLVLLNNSPTPQPQVNEDQGGHGDTNSISRVPDGGQQRKTSTYVVQSPTPGTFNVAQPFGVELLQSGTRIDIQEGGATDSYQIALLSIPTGDVHIVVTPDSQTKLNAAGPGASITLDFTPANALIPQTITVTAVDDAVVEGNHTSTITHSVTSIDSRYNGLSVSNVVAVIVDNDVPAPPSIVISEIMYAPASVPSPTGSREWIEVINTGAGATNLAGWLFDDEDNTNWGAIPTTTATGTPTVLNPNQVAVIFDSDTTDENTFRSDWSVPANALVVGIPWGSLLNNPAGPGDEVVKLLNNVGVQMDVVNYDNTSPWPTGLDGRSIYLKNLSLDNNSGANWARSAVGTANAVAPTGAEFSASDAGSPGRFYLAGDYNASASVDAADYVMWRKSNINGATGFTDWRINFGAGITTASGGSPLTDEPVATAGLSEPAAVTASGPQASISLDTNSAFDEAITQFGLATNEATVTTSSSRTVQLSASGGSSLSSGDLLLTLAPGHSSRLSGFSPDSADFTSTQEAEAIDTLFASLDGLAEEQGVAASLL